MMNNLSYDEWRAQFCVEIPSSTDSSSDVSNSELDVALEVEKMLQYQYSVYLKGGATAILNHNMMVMHMQMDPTIDPITIPPLME